MAYYEHDELPKAVRHYAEIADAVNRREMDRFINEVKSKWNPEPGRDYTEPHYDGYTDIAATNLHIYQLAFDDMDPPREEPLCEAEKYNQILLKPPIEELADCIPKPLTNPLPPDEVSAKLEAIKVALRQQVEAAGTMQPTQLEMPEDFQTLMTLTDGLNAAGIPRETQQTKLVYSLAQQRVGGEMLETISIRARRRSKLVLATWEIGGSLQHRRIYYVFCHSSSDGNEVSDGNKLPPKWTIVNHYDVEVDFYDDLAHFLQHETESVEGTPGGAIIDDSILRYESYPIF